MSPFESGGIEERCGDMGIGDKVIKRKETVKRKGLKLDGPTF
jgi:hypothetical protein